MVRGRSLAFAAWIVAATGVTHVSAQTVIVRSLPPGTPVEFVLNTTVVASGTADAEGLVRLVAGADALAERQQIDAQVWVDRCADRRRVLLVDRSVLPPSSETCTREAVAGLFVVQRVSNLVIDGGGSPPTLRLRQGPAPDAWLRPPAEGAAVEGTRRVLPTGLMLSGGGGLGRIRDFTRLTCGNFNPCSSDRGSALMTGGVVYWFSPYVGAEATYLRLGGVSASGRGGGVGFDSDMEGGLLAVAAKGGLPIGPVRLMGSAGSHYHRLTETTAQTFDGTTVTVDGVPQDIPGGEQTIQWRTRGWGFTWSGGAEVWVSGSVAIFGEAGRHFLKGNDDRGAQARIDDAHTFTVLGVRVRLF